MGLVSLFIGLTFVNNVVLSKFYAVCPLLGVSKKPKNALNMGYAVTFVIFVASIVTYAIYHGVLKPLEITYLDLITFILVIASLVQFVEMFLKKTSPEIYKSMGVYLPLITTNCAVLGVALDNISATIVLLKQLLLVWQFLLVLQLLFMYLQQLEKDLILQMFLQVLKELQLH